MTLSIIYPTESPLPLYCKYPQQHDEQPARVELDCELWTLSADYNPVIGSGAPPEIWHGRTRTYECRNTMTTDEVRVLLDSVAALAESVCEGYETVWNGHNHVGTLTPEAQSAEEEMKSLCESTLDDDPEWQIWDTGEWLYETRNELLDRIKNGESISDLASEIENEAREACAHLTGNIEQMLAHFVETYGEEV
jgi:hypothetical protein